ncbi:MAG: HFLK protein [Bacteroidota bacterium]
MADDYGYFGSGDAGYAHYVAASGEDRDPKNGGNGGGPKKGGGPNRGRDSMIGCLGILLIFAFLAIIGNLVD